MRYYYLYQTFFCLFIFSIPKKGNPKKILLTSGISTLVLIIHFIIEGLRWQMGFLYCITALFLVVSIYQYFNKQKIPKPFTRFLSIFLAVLTIISAGLSIYIPVFKIPEPTGGFEVGTQTFYFVDENRNETFTEDENDKRKLMVQVWYPAQNTTGKKQLYFIQNGKEMLHAIAKGNKIPELFIDYLKYIKSNSYEDARISSSSSSYPLIILNHGLGSSRLLHISQAENLASHGYIVASIDHIFSTIASIFLDGSVTHFKTLDKMLDESLEYRDNVGKVWTGDVIFTVDQFEKINSGYLPSRFKGKIDFSNIGIFGHSFGGAAAYDSCYYDSRIKAGIDMDGSLYAVNNKEVIKKPFMFMFSEQTFDLYNKIRQNYVHTDEELQVMGCTREQYNKDIKDAKLQTEQFKATIKNGGYLLYIGGINHYNFTDLQLISPLTRFIGMTGEINGERSAFIVNQYILDFFNKYLKGNGGRLLEGTNEEYPEVKYPASLFIGGRNNKGAYL